MIRNLVGNNELFHYYKTQFSYVKKMKKSEISAGYTKFTTLIATTFVTMLVWCGVCREVWYGVVTGQKAV